MPARHHVNPHVRVPPAKVGLSTSSVYPETTSSAFELAHRLGYDGVEVFVQRVAVTDRTRLSVWAGQAGRYQVLVDGVVASDDGDMALAHQALSANFSEVWPDQDPQLRDGLWAPPAAGHVLQLELPELVRLYETEGSALQQEFLGTFVGAFTTDVGELSTYTHLWAYESHADREERRARLQAHERWKAFLAKLQPLIHTQWNRIMVPTSFSPVR